MLHYSSLIQNSIESSSSINKKKKNTQTLPIRTSKAKSITVVPIGLGSSAMSFLRVESSTVPTSCRVKHHKVHMKGAWQYQQACITKLEYVFVVIYRLDALIVGLKLKKRQNFPRSGPIYFKTQLQSNPSFRITF